MTARSTRSMEDDSDVMLPNMIENTAAAVSSLKNRRRSSRGGGSGKYQLAITAEDAAIKYIVHQTIDDRGQTVVDDTAYQPTVSPDVNDGSSVRTPLLRGSHQHADMEEPVSPGVDAQSSIPHITRINVQHVADGGSAPSPRVRAGPATRRTRNQHRSVTHAVHTVDDESITMHPNHKRNLSLQAPSEIRSTLHRHMSDSRDNDTPPVMSRPTSMGNQVDSQNKPANTHSVMQRTRTLARGRSFHAGTGSQHALDVAGTDDGSSDAVLPKGVIHPGAYWLPTWHVFVLVCVMYQVCTVPFTISFWPTYNDVSRDDVFIILIFDVITDIAFIVDLYITAHTAYTEHSVLITEKKLIRRHYLQNWFAADFLAALPLDIAEIGIGQVVPWLRIPKLLRLLKTMIYFNRVESANASDENAFKIRIIKLIFYTCLLSHFVACVKYQVMVNQINENESHPLDADNIPSPDDPLEDLEHRPYFSRYLQALYWGMAAVTGRDDTDPPHSFNDTLFTVIMMVIGVVWFAYIVASLESFAESSPGVAGAMDFQARLKYTNTFMSTYKIPQRLQDQVRAYYNYLWSSSLRHESQYLLKKLPSGLHADLLSYLYGKLLGQTELLANGDTIPHGLIALLASKLTVVTAVPTEIICATNTVGTCMWFIQEGEVEILVGGHKSALEAKSIATLRTGDYFGEYSIFVSKFRTSTARAQTYCTLLVLTAEDMLHALHLYPGSEQTIRTYVMEHRQRTKQQEGNLLGLNMDGEGTESGNAKAAARNAKLKRLMMSENTDDSAKKNSTVKWTVSPSNKNYQLFTLCYFLFILYNLIIIPVRFAWVDPRLFITVATLDYLGDSVFLADIFLQTRLRYTDRGEEVTDTRKIWQRYVKGGVFALDVASSVPLDFFMLLPGVGVTALLRLNRVLRITHANQAILKRIKHHPHHELISLLYFLLTTLLLAHWTSCVYYAFTKFEGFGATNQGWLMPDFLMDQPVIYQYLRAMFFSMSLLGGIGRHNFPPSDVDVILTLIMMLMGVFVVSYVIGKVGHLVINLSAAVAAHKADLQSYSQYLTYNNVPTDISGRIQTYFNHKWNIQKGIDPNVALQPLPYALRADIMLHLCETLLRSIPKFSSMDESFVRSLAAELRFFEAPAGEYIFRQGYVGNTLYLVGNGLVELLVNKPRPRLPEHSQDSDSINTSSKSCRPGADGSSDVHEHEEYVLKTVGTGSLFGEAAMFTGIRSLSARTKSSCQLLVLSSDSFKKMIQLNVSFASVIQKLNTERMAKIGTILHGPGHHAQASRLRGDNEDGTAPTKPSKRFVMTVNPPLTPNSPSNAANGYSALDSPVAQHLKMVPAGLRPLLNKRLDVGPHHTPMQRSVGQARSSQEDTDDPTALNDSTMLQTPPRALNGQLHVTVQEESTPSTDNIEHAGYHRRASSIEARRALQLSAGSVPLTPPPSQLAARASGLVARQISLPQTNSIAQIVSAAAELGYRHQRSLTSTKFPSSSPKHSVFNQLAAPFSNGAADQHQAADAPQAATDQTDAAGSSVSHAIAGDAEASVVPSDGNKHTISLVELTTAATSQVVAEAADSIGEQLPDAADAVPPLADGSVERVAATSDTQSTAASSTTVERGDAHLVARGSVVESSDTALSEADGRAV